MERRHQALLERNYTALLRSMEIERMLDCMRGSELFGIDCEEVDRASHGSTRMEKGRLIIEGLMRKGPQAFPFFVFSLYKTSTHKALAEKLARDGGVSLKETEHQLRQPTPPPGHIRAVQQTSVVTSNPTSKPFLDYHHRLPALSGLPSLPFEPPLTEDDPCLYNRREIYGERPTVHATQVCEENSVRTNPGELVFGSRTISRPGRL